MPPGLECYKSIKSGLENCIPCEGIYFNVGKDEDIQPVEQLKEYTNIVKKYKEYKSGFTKGAEGKDSIFIHI